jgi:hypothetical protein
MNKEVFFLMASKLDATSEKLIDIISSSFEALTMVNPDASEHILEMLNEQLPNQVAKIRGVDKLVLDATNEGSEQEQ